MCCCEPRCHGTPLECHLFVTSSHPGLCLFPVLLLGCSLHLLSPWFRNRGCVGSAPSRASAQPLKVPCGVAQLPREHKGALEQVVLQVPSLEPGMLCCGAPRGGCAGLTWPCPTSSAAPASAELTFQTHLTSSRMDRAQKGRGFISSRVLAQVIHSWMRIFWNSGFPQKCQSSSDQQQSLTGCLHPSTDPGALTLLLSLFLSGTEPKPSPSFPAQPPHSLFL